MEFSQTGYEHLDNLNTVLQSRFMLEMPEYQPLTKAQMRGALSCFNMLKQFDEFAENAESAMKEYWQSANAFNREDKFINEMAKKLQLTGRQIDSIFEMGLTL